MYVSKNTEEMLMDGEKWRNVAVVTMDLNGPQDVEEKEEEE